MPTCIQSFIFQLLGKEAMMRTTYAVAFLLTITGTSSIACEIDTPTDWLPGYTKEQREIRSDEILRARRHVLQYQQAENGMTNARVVYLARVLQSQHFQRDRLEYRASIQPLKPLKRLMPGTRQLASEDQDSCGWADGDGDATFASPGELVVVFEGLPKSKARPRGIDSMRMVEVTYGSLLDPIQEWLETQPGYADPLD